MTSPDLDELVDATLGRLSLEEKVGQLFVSWAYGQDAERPTPRDAARNRESFGIDAPADIVRRYGVGGIIYFAWSDNLGAPRQVAQLSNGLQRAAVEDGRTGVPLLVSVDQEQGAVVRLGSPFTEFPGNMALGAGRSSRDAYRAALVTARELAAVGINQDHAPDVDVSIDPRNPVIGDRQRSADAFVDLLTGTGPTSPRGSTTDPTGIGAAGGGPAVAVDVVVSAETLQGIADGPAVLDDQTTLTTGQARTLAYGDGARWRRLVIDPVTGRLLACGEKTYLPGDWRRLPPTQSRRPRRRCASTGPHRVSPGTCANATGTVNSWAAGDERSVATWTTASPGRRPDQPGQPRLPVPPTSQVETPRRLAGSTPTTTAHSPGPAHTAAPTPAHPTTTSTTCEPAVKRCRVPTPRGPRWTGRKRDRLGRRRRDSDRRSAGGRT